MNEKSLKWVKRAASKDKARPKLNELSRLDGRIVATDGYRIHACKGESDIPSINGFPDCISFLENGMQGASRVTISKYHLMRALKAAMSLKKRRADIYGKWKPQVKICISGSALYLESESAEIGKITVYIRDGDNWRGKSTKVKYPNGRPNIAHYELTGPSLYIAIDPKFLMDALRGMGDTLTMIFKDKHSPVYLASGDHEAVIMPLYR